MPGLCLPYRRTKYPEIDDSDQWVLPEEPTLGQLVFHSQYGLHPELGLGFYGSKADWDSAITFQYKYYPIENEL